MLVVTYYSTQWILVFLQFVAEDWIQHYLNGRSFYTLTLHIIISYTYTLYMQTCALAFTNHRKNKIHI